MVFAWYDVSAYKSYAAMNIKTFKKKEILRQIFMILCLDLII